jgi:hypothetical protein
VLCRNLQVFTSFCLLLHLIFGLHLCEEQLINLPAFQDYIIPGFVLIKRIYTNCGRLDTCDHLTIHDQVHGLSVGLFKEPADHRATQACICISVQYPEELGYFETCAQRCEIGSIAPEENTGQNHWVSTSSESWHWSLWVSAMFCMYGDGW